MRIPEIGFIAGTRAAFGGAWVVARRQIESWPTEESWVGPADDRSGDERTDHRQCASKAPVNRDRRLSL